MATFYPLKKVNTQSTVIVTAASTLVLAENPHRKYALLVNESTVDMWIKFGAAPAVNNGIFIARNGFAYEIDDRNLWVGNIYAIRPAGGGVRLMGVLEFS